jgi:lipoate-protein ligase A
MHLMELTLPTLAENVALDEALLDAAEDGSGPAELLRIWEPPKLGVVIGRSSRAAEEVRLAECSRRGVPVVRRSSGGAAIVTGPGCLMYALVLSYGLRPRLRLIDQAHLFVLHELAQHLGALMPTVRCAGTSDLAAGDRKFSGNSVRCKRGHLVYHGTLLYGFPLHEVDALLALPPRQPAYRAGRAHGEFLANIELPREQLRQSLIAAFSANEPLEAWPRERTRQLVEDRYNRAEWNLAR